MSHKQIYTISLSLTLSVVLLASVGGGIPIIKGIKESLAGNKITSVMGIINGTCNFILTKMKREKTLIEQEYKIRNKKLKSIENKLKNFSKWLFKLSENHPIDSKEYKLIEKVGKEFEKR